jgi:hypothetical protein
MAKSKIKKVVETVKEKVSSTVLLRDASTGAFFEGVGPVGKSPSGNRGGVPFWEVTR